MQYKGYTISRTDKALVRKQGFHPSCLNYPYMMVNKKGNIASLATSIDMLVKSITTFR